ncbi:hypothetical protein LXA43DRAFT_492062 [Ganoderma leucocontextum]|nr:hypothetical protein LXA43DRAFT_492062 [Ganoderma leucocontextum]
MSKSLEPPVQDEFPLLHLLELVSREQLLEDISLSYLTERQSCTRHLNPDDATALRTLKPEDVQNWCLSRIAHYHALIRAVRAQPDLVLYNGSLHGFVIRHKSHIRALRSIYNGAVPIHRRLPPEILLEVFANFHHDGTRREHAAFRVCHYWRTLLQRTPQLWQALLSQEFSVTWDPQWKFNRFAAAFSRSAPLDLSLCLRGIDDATVDVLAAHSRRLTSMTFRNTGYRDKWDTLERFLQLDMPMLRCLDIRRSFSGKVTGTRAARFFAFPHLETLRVASACLGPLETPYTSLKHLELRDCRGCVAPNAPFLVKVPIDLHTLLANIRNCPNLETLCVAGPLRPNTWPDPESPVDVPRLRHLTLQLPPDSTLALLSCLILPLTTVLDLEPLLVNDVPLPLSTSIVTPLHRPPVAEVTIHLKSTNSKYDAKNAATWEAQGDGSRPLRVSTTRFYNLESPHATLAQTSQILAIFAPGTAVTSLTITSGRSSRPEGLWTALLAGLPNLERLAVKGIRARDYPRILPLLSMPQGDGGCLCPTLTNLSVPWDPQSDPEAWTALIAEGPQATTASASGEASSQLWIDEPVWRSYGPTAIHSYCRVLQHCLRSRAEHGCLSLQAISIGIWDRGHEAEVEATLREGLGDLVEEVSVGGVARPARNMRR